MDAAPNQPNNHRREEELAALLIDLAPLLRSRIRARRGKRLGHIGTSDIYASVTRRALEIEQTEGLASVPTGATRAEDRRSDGSHDPRGLWRLLHILVDRVIVDAKRRQRAHDRAVAESSRAQAAREHAGPEQSTLTAEEKATLRELVGRLSAQDRELITLRLSGRAWPDIAATLGWTAATSRQRWHRLVEQLAGALGER